ncbi:MAG TPA: hypothetical protein VGL81_16675 [Polyangiaceae bacterium]|jgi:hypothetical protein
MRCLPTPFALVAFLAPLVAFCASSACSPALQPPGTGGTPFADDASALASFDYDGGWGDDGGDTEPAWDAGPELGVDAVSPLMPGDGGVPDTGSPVDAEVDAGCTQPLGAGDLVIDELMIESVAGAGDDGEWLEVASTAACAVNLGGLHGECPVGAKVYSFDVLDDLWIPPGGTFLIADSTDPAVNHYLPGLVIPWGGHPGDVLRNLGGTVTLSDGDVLIVSLTWPSLKPVVGTTVELPADCPVVDADDFGEWQTATASWFPGFFGTPNAPNTDVPCP